MRTRVSAFARGAVVVAMTATFGSALAQSISTPAPPGTPALKSGTAPATTPQTVPAQSMQAPVLPLQAPVQPPQAPVQPLPPLTNSPITSPSPLPPLNTQAPGAPLTAGTGPATVLSVPSRGDTAQTAFRALDPINRGFVTRADTDRIAGFQGFDNADTDRDGRLTLEEFQNAWNRFAPQSHSITEQGGSHEDQQSTHERARRNRCGHAERHGCCAIAVAHATQQFRGDPRWHSRRAGDRDCAGPGDDRKLVDRVRKARYPASRLRHAKRHRPSSGYIAFDSADRNHDGRLDIDEFQRAWSDYRSGGQ